MIRWLTDLAVWLFEWAKWKVGAVFAWIEHVAWWRIKMAWFDRRCLRRKIPRSTYAGPNPLVTAEFIDRLDKALKKQPHIGPLLARLNASGQVEFIDKEESEGQNGQADKGRDQHKIPPPPAER